MSRRDDDDDPIFLDSITCKRGSIWRSATLVETSRSLLPPPLPALPPCTIDDVLTLPEALRTGDLIDLDDTWYISTTLCVILISVCVGNKPRHLSAITPQGSSYRLILFSL